MRPAASPVCSPTRCASRRQVSERLAERSPQLVAIDAEPPRDVVGDAVDPSRPERERSDPGEGQFLERAPGVSAFGHAASWRAAGGGARAAT